MVDHYRVERSQSVAGSFEPVQQTSGQVTTAVDTGLTPGTTYFYWVVAINATGESPSSNVVSGSTRQRGLPAPQNVTAELLPDGRIQLDWDPGPTGATTAIEYSERGLLGYEPLGSTGAAGPWSHHPGEPTLYIYRLKFVLGEAESEYAETTVVIVPETWRLYLPLIRR